MADSQAEVYVAKEPYFEVHTHNVLGTETVYRGCVYGSDRSVRLGSVTNEPVGSAPSIGSRHMTLDGTIVAYERYATASASGEGAGYFEVFVRNLRSGQLLDRVPTGMPLEARRFYVGVGSVRTMVVKADGAVAWIALDFQRSEQLARLIGREVNYYDLYALDSSGERLLASGTELAPSSLALAGSTLYWTQGGRPFSAGLE